MSPSVFRSRSFATEEAKEKAEHPAVDLTEKEKEMMGTNEKLAKDVETLTEKNKELDVS